MIWVKHWTEGKEGLIDVDIFNITQIVQDTVIHLGVDDPELVIFRNLYLIIFFSQVLGPSLGLFYLFFISLYLILGYSL